MPTDLWAAVLPMVSTEHLGWYVAVLVAVGSGVVVSLVARMFMTHNRKVLHEYEGHYQRVLKEYEGLLKENTEIITRLVGRLDNLTEAVRNLNYAARTK